MHTRTYIRTYIPMYMHVCLLLRTLQVLTNGFCTQRYTPCRYRTPPPPSRFRSNVLVPSCFQAATKTPCHVMFSSAWLASTVVACQTHTLEKRNIIGKHDQVREAKVLYLVLHRQHMADTAPHISRFPLLALCCTNVIYFQPGQTAPESSHPM